MRGYCMSRRPASPVLGARMPVDGPRAELADGPLSGPPTIVGPDALPTAGAVVEPVVRGAALVVARGVPPLRTVLARMLLKIDVARLERTTRVISLPVARLITSVELVCWWQIARAG